jgi:hypothetical protein
LNRNWKVFASLAVLEMQAVVLVLGVACMVPSFVLLCLPIAR